MVIDGVSDREGALCLDSNPTRDITLDKDYTKIMNRLQKTDAVHNRARFLETPRCIPPPPPGGLWMA